MDTPDEQEGSRSSFENQLVDELAGMLQDRLTRDPELRRLAELVGMWLVRASRSAARGHGAHAAATAELPQGAAQDQSSDAPQEVDGASFEGAQATGMLAEVKPSSSNEPPIHPELLQALLQQYENPGVSPAQPGLAGGSPPARPTTPQRRDVASLEGYARRMELKADACRWARQRTEAEASGKGFDSVKPMYNELLERADTMQPCYLWMIQRDTDFIESEAWTRLEGCYRACAETLHAIVEFPEAYASSPELLLLLGETQSAIRAGMEACGAYPKWTDNDQQAVFEWCRDEGEFRKVYNQFLSLSRLADPSLHRGMLARAQKIRSTLSEQRDRQRMQTRSLNTIRYHIGQIENHDPNLDHHWSRIVEGIIGALDAGLLPSSTDLVELLEPIADDIPSELLEQPRIQEVFRYVDQRIARKECAGGEPLEAVRETTPEIRLVREALRGTRMVLIGGEPRPHSKAALEREFELSELDWQVSEAHTPHSRFESAITQPDTRVVAIMIRWSSHSYEGLQEICEKHGKVFVRLPGGYSPAQVAHQIVEQASIQLGLAQPEARSAHSGE
ncbi:MAG: hypothetical protein D6695_01580 [Planctomycetota bacterium]|nr:MAG: hypothetical protein D6695_01580 [Planctomycetota bacterium]